MEADPSTVLLVVGINVVVLLAAYVGSRLMFLDLGGLGHQKAARELPGLAAKLGLHFSEAELIREIGSIQGDYRGRDTRILVDHATILLQLRTAESLTLATYAPQRRHPPSGLVEFETGNRSFDRFFQTRYARPEVPRENASRGELDFVRIFKKRWGRCIDFLVVGDGGGIRCKLKYGFSGTYIPAHVLEKILADLCDLAELVEGLCRS